MASKRTSSRHSVAPQGPTRAGAATAGNEPRQTPQNNTSKWIVWSVLGAAILFAVVVRWRLADFPLERDEGEYAYAGQLILEGVPPYRLACNMKLPGTYLAYAGLMAVFGQTTAGIHFGLLIVNLATILLIFFLTRDLFDPVAAAVAAAAYAILSISPTVLGQAAHATHFMALLGVAGAWCLWRAMRNDRAWLFLIAGLLLGIAFLTKQQGVFLPLFGGLAVFVFAWKRAPFSWRRLFVTCLTYAAAALLPYLAVCLWLWMAGTFDKFWFWTVSYARTYVAQVPLSLAPRMLWNNVQSMIGANWPILLLALMGVFVSARSKGIPGRRAFFFAFVVFSFLCVCPGFWFRSHYFIVFLPCIAMLAGLGAAGLVEVMIKLFVPRRVEASPRRRDDRRKNAVADRPPPTGDGLARWLTALVVGFAMLLPILQQSGFFFFWSPSAACRRVYTANPFVEAPVIAAYIAEHSKPDDRIAVVGSEPEIFFYAKRRSATSHLYTYALMEPHPFARKMQNEMIEEIESAKPEYLIFVNVPTSWLARPDSDMHLLQWFPKYAAAHYQPVGLIDILSQFETNYRWGAEAADTQPQSSCHLWVFRRK